LRYTARLNLNGLKFCVGMSDEHILGSEGARFEILRSQSLVQHDRRLAARSCLYLARVWACVALLWRYFEIWREISSFAPFSAQVADLTKSRAKFLAHNSFSYPLRNEISPFLGEISSF